MVKARGSDSDCITNLNPSVVSQRFRITGVRHCVLESKTRGLRAPVQALLVVAVDLARLLELGGEVLDGFGIVFGVQVHDESVGCHCRTLGMKILFVGDLMD